MTAIQHHTFDNGLQLLVEPIANVASCSITWLVPAGVIAQNDQCQGVASIASEMLHRGAGDLDAKSHSDALDALGIQRSVDPGTWHTRLGATMMATRLDAGLPLLVDMIRRPKLEDETFEPSRQLALQTLEALDDDPQQRAMIELKQLHMGEPIGWSSMGVAEQIRAMKPQDVRSFWADRYAPNGSILALAGKVSFETVRDQIGQLLGDWDNEATPITSMPQRIGSSRHITAESTQQHIGLAHAAVGESHPDTLQQRLAVAILSGGMSGRLFTEVREERGLCYSVYASYWSTRDFGAVFAYAGTTAPRAAETVEVMRHELSRLSDGVEPEEFSRARTGLQARIVMQGESTAARAAAIAGDQFLRGKPRTLEDLSAMIDGTDVDQLNRFLAERGAIDMTQLTIGPEAAEATQ
jgi:predicted Zn-dependent peptidase